MTKLNRIGQLLGMAFNTFCVFIFTVITLWVIVIALELTQAIAYHRIYG